MDAATEREQILRLITRIGEHCPERHATSESERRAHQIVLEELSDCGLETSQQEFRFPDSIHKNFALHFGLGSLGTAAAMVAPGLAMLLHGAAAGSFWLDATHRSFVLRRLLRFRPSQNVMGVLPAEGAPVQRIVLLAHVDAPFTGWVFEPRIASLLAKRMPRWRLLGRPAELATKSQALLVGVDGLLAALGPLRPLAWPLYPIELGLGTPGLLMFLANLEILLRRNVSPGVNDNLSAVAALCALARRLTRSKRRDVEIVFVATGCEEAGWGGAKALAAAKEAEWDKQSTVVIALDCLSNGVLRYVTAEGEVSRMPIPAWLESVVREVASSDERFRGMTGFEAPVGGTDATAFLARGWQAMALVAVDPELGMPRHYHRATDTVEHLDLDQLVLAIDFTEKLVRALCDRAPRPA